MRLRPLNKTIVIEVDAEYMPMDENQKVLDVVNRGIIVIPEKNSIMKLSPFGNVVRAAEDCWYPYKKGQRIAYNQFFDKPVWYDDADGKRYRLIKEWYVNLIYED